MDSPGVASDGSNTVMLPLAVVTRTRILSCLTALSADSVLMQAVRLLRPAVEKCSRLRS
jgi:hypothetical protein